MISGEKHLHFVPGHKYTNASTTRKTKFCIPNKLSFIVLIDVKEVCVYDSFVCVQPQGHSEYETPRFDSASTCVHKFPKKKKQSSRSISLDSLKKHCSPHSYDPNAFTAILLITLLDDSSSVKADSSSSGMKASGGTVCI